MHIGIPEILLIILLIIVLFGTSRFPRIMQNLAEGLKVFKKSMNEKEGKSNTKSQRTSSKNKSTKTTKKKKINSK